MDCPVVILAPSRMSVMPCALFECAKETAALAEAIVQARASAMPIFSVRDEGMARASCDAEFFLH
jgi:hypothetical protein